MARAAALLLTTLLVANPAAAELPGRYGPQAAHALLDVPYVPQTPELCGGAALAMVMRYWGERQVFPDDFASLVVASERGIPTGVLVAAARSRKWQATVLSADDRDIRLQIRAALDRGQPLIALIEVSPRTYHYVVLVGATGNEIVLHDPARSPFRVLSWEAFDRAWEAANRWMMLVLPPADVRPDLASILSPPAAPPGTAATMLTPCDALVERGVNLALGDDRDAAEQALVAATRVCASNAAAWRELAGWRFAQSRWADAQAFAAVAVRLAPDDALARELLATSRYLAGDAMGALDAWTPAGEPRIDQVSVNGAERTPHPLVVDVAGLQPRQLLTSEAFERALRRVQALPVAASARMQYEPIGGGLAKVEVSLIERERYPRGWRALAILGGRAVVGHELKVETAGLFDAGERISVSGRWQEERPRVSLALMAPSPSFLPGVASFEGMWERQSYPALRESRRRAALQLGDWSTSWLRWKTGVALDRFDARRYVSLEGGLDLRLARNRLAFASSGVAWVPTDEAAGFATAAVLVAWRSTVDSTTGTWTMSAAVNAAGRSAPLAVWEGAGTGSARAGLLRAHPLLHDGVLNGSAFGRRLARGTLEYARPVGHTLAGAISIAAFVDAARAWQRLTPGRSPLFIDAGAGVRVRIPGRAETIRLDLARGLRGGDVALSVGWLGEWPR